MIHSVVLYYFSGTGNTRTVTEELQKQFQQQGVRCDMIALDQVLKGETLFRLNGYDLVGIGWPVHALNAAQIVHDFFTRFPLRSNVKEDPARIFLYKTAGDCFLKGGATTDFRNPLIQKGYDVFYEQLFVMPANIFFRYPDRLIKQLYLTARANARIVVKEILAGKRQLQRNTLISTWIARGFGRLEREGAKYFVKDLRTTPTCSLCGKCVWDCPNANISEEGGKIRFGTSCSFCLRCVEFCPHHAITAKWYKFILLTRFYDLRKIARDAHIRPDFLTPQSNPYWRRLYRHIMEKIGESRPAARAHTNKLFVT